MKAIFAALLLPLCGLAAIWPENFGPYHRTATAPVTLSDRPVWDEYGFKEADSATFEKDGKKFVATAWRLQDPTGALAAFQWQRPADARPAPFAKYAVQDKNGSMATFGNYLFRFEKFQPETADFVGFASGLPYLDQSALPPLIGYMPTGRLQQNSERYILGPISLERFSPGIPASTVLFNVSAEGEVATFDTPKGPMKAVIFNYPNPQFAMERVNEFSKIGGAVVKRSGPLVAVILSPPDPEVAQQVLSQVRYEAQITFTERVPTRKDNIGDLIINAFVLIGILLGFALVAGLAVGGFRGFRSLKKRGDEPEAMILLHLREK